MTAPPTVHATAVALGTRGVLLLGPSGAGKSDLALRLVAAGWRLVADDRVVLTAQQGRLQAMAPAPLAGLLEVRGVGIVPQATSPTILCLALDLASPPERLPEAASWAHAGLALPLLAFDGFGQSAPERAARALASWGLPAQDAAVPESPAPSPRPHLVVTGMSGAGKSTVLKALEDLGFEALDNLPLPLLDAVLAAATGPLALGMDVRSRAFDAEALVARLRALRGGGTDIRTLYLDAGDDVLQRRFSETRRRHPLAPDRPAADGLASERELTAPLKRWADLVVDSSDFFVADLRRAVAQRLGLESAGSMAVLVTSFGYAHGLPRDADLVFDMRFLANPHWDPALRPLTGQDAAVAAYVAADPGYAPTLARIADLVTSLLPGYRREGKAYLTIAIGCTGGRHRSVAVAIDLAARLAAHGQPVALVHRDVGKAGGDAAVVAAAPLTMAGG
jgi:RNase adaptor protein for sRNA GlmZ degradation